MAAAASPQPPPSTRCTSRSRPPLSRGQALAASTAHSCECSSGRSSDHVCECRNPQPDRTPPDEQPSQQRQLAYAFNHEGASGRVIEPAAQRVFQRTYIFRVYVTGRKGSPWRLWCRAAARGAVAPQSWRLPSGRDSPARQRADPAATGRQFASDSPLGHKDSLDPDTFSYRITSQEVA